MEGKKEEILITGGLGYIGSHTVVELISQGESVVIVDNLNNTDIKCLDRLREITVKPENIVYYDVDINNEKAMDEAVFAKHNLKSTIHFAAFKAVGESVQKPLDYYMNNVGGTITLLRLMQKYGVKTFVFSSSACVYGENPKCIEDDIIQPLNPYG